MESDLLIGELPLPLCVFEGGEEVEDDVHDEENVHQIFVHVEEGKRDLERNEVGHQSQVVENRQKADQVPNKQENLVRIKQEFKAFFLVYRLGSE